MAKKKEEKEIETKDNINTDEIKKDIDEYLYEKKEEIVDSIMQKTNEEVESAVNKRMKEEEKKLVQGKNAKIFRKNVLIIILIALLGYFGYCLYEVDYFNIRTKDVKEPASSDEQDSHTSTKENYDSPYYIKNYSYLVDNMQISDEHVFDLYTKNVTRDNMSNDLKLKIAYKNLDEEKKTIEDGTISFESTDLLEAGKKVFGENVVLNNLLFSYNNNKYMYYNGVYLGFENQVEPSNLVYEIYEARLEDDKMIFEVVVGKKVQDGLFTIKDVKVENYKNDSLVGYKNVLNKYRYTFTKEKEDYIFSSIEAI